MTDATTSATATTPQPSAAQAQVDANAARDATIAATQAKVAGTTPAKPAVDHRHQAKLDAKRLEPTADEIEYVARLMDYDSVLDWENKPERRENARVAAKTAILGYRACQRLGEKAKQWPVGQPVVPTMPVAPVSPVASSPPPFPVPPVAAAPAPVTSPIGIVNVPPPGA